MSSASADVSVRVAWADDAPAVAALQLRAWTERYADHLAAGGVPDAAAQPGAVDAATDAWRTSLASPGDARNRVLVALAHERVVGFAVTGPAADPDCDPVRDGELRELAVATAERGRGHGSRLLQAVADTLRADRFRRAVTWVGTTEDDLRGFLSDAGWATDGAHRELGAEDGAPAGRLRQVRLHTSLVEG